MENDVFCRIIKKELPSELLDEDADFIVIKDINPKAPIHLLIIAKKHIGSVKELKDAEAELAGKMILKAKNIALKLKLPGYKLVFNVGAAGGQIIKHLHLHLLGGLIKDNF